MKLLQRIPRPSRLIALTTIYLIGIILVGFATSLLLISTIDNYIEHNRIEIYAREICLIEGYPDFTVIKDRQDHWRAFCKNANEAVEIPMHPDLNLPNQ